MRRFGILTDETFPQWRGPLHEGIAHIMVRRINGESFAYVTLIRSLSLALRGNGQERVAGKCPLNML